MRRPAAAVTLVAIFVVCATAAVMAYVPPYSARHCPPNWLYREDDDQCYRAFPTPEHNTTTKVSLTFDDATTFCDTQGGQLPVITNSSLQEFLTNLVGAKSGDAYWNGIRKLKSDKQKNQQWVTRNHRIFTTYFDWDHRREMPTQEECVAVHTKGDPLKRINGGTGRMITMSCDEPATVVCQKPRVPMSIGGVNRTRHGQLRYIFGDDVHLEFIGSHIPQGTRVTLQTTTEGFFPHEPFQPTNCSKIGHMGGASIPFVLNVTQFHYEDKLCNGTCDVASVIVPRTLPLVRGAKYSLCFFQPFPFATPLQQEEYGNDLLSGLSIELIQRREKYLQDVCTRHAQNVDMFYGHGDDDTNRDRVTPFYFDTPYQDVFETFRQW